jgi:hypothetical protein
MKTNKLLMLCLLMTVFAVSANAQASQFKFSVGGGISSYSAGGGRSTTGFGIDVVGKTDVSENFEGFVQTGYNSYSADGGTWGVIPVLVGANYKAGSLKPGLGIGYSKLNFSGGEGNGGFTFSPQLGYSFDKFDVIGHYTSFSINSTTVNVIGLKALYNF